MQKKTRSIFEELDGIYTERYKKLEEREYVVESRASNVIASAVRLMEQIEQRRRPAFVRLDSLLLSRSPRPSLTQPTSPHLRPRNTPGTGRSAPHLHGRRGNRLCPRRRPPARPPAARRGSKLQFFDNCRRALAPIRRRGRRLRAARGVGPERRRM